jgi:hypothetical protein
MEEEETRKYKLLVSGTVNVKQQLQAKNTHHHQQDKIKYIVL